MNAFFRNLALVICMCLALAGTCLGQQVYLRDGGIVDCQSFWRSGDKVMVKINRDIIVDFQTSEVNMQRTFRATDKKAHHARRQAPVEAAPAPEMQKQVAAVAVPAPSVQPAPAAPTPVPAPVPVQAPAGVEKAAPQPVPAQSEPQPVATDYPAQLSKEEVEARKKEAAEMMAQAIRNNDQELMKKAIEMQQSIVRANPNNAANMAAALGFMALARKIMIISLVISLLMIASTWVIFEKAGDSGWKSLVPIYNGYVLMEVSGCPGWWVVLLFVPLANLVFFLLAMLSLAGKFGRGALFGVGLWLLPMFFFPMLAFGGSRYEG